MYILAGTHHLLAIIVVAMTWTPGVIEISSSSGRASRVFGTSSFI